MCEENYFPSFSEKIILLEQRQLIWAWTFYGVAAEEGSYHSKRYF